MTRIRRAVIGGPRQAALEEAELPDTPLEPHEVLLRAYYSALSTGTELAYYAGDQSLGHRPVPYPFHSGYAAVGEVIAAGPEARVSAGDRVLAHTPHQDLVRFDSRRTVCVRLPDGLSLDLAPLARLAQVGAVSIRLMTAHPGNRVAVVGLGLVGNLAAQLAGIAGMHVVGVEPLPARRALAQRCGVADVLDPGELQPENDPRVGPQNSCPVVLECSGRERGVLTALSLAAPHGEIFLVGAAWKPDTGVMAAQIIRPVFDKYLALRSGWEWQVPRYADGQTESIARITAWLLDCLRDGLLHMAELVTDRVRPEDVASAYAGLLDHPDEHLGVIVDWR